MDSIINFKMKNFLRQDSVLAQEYVDYLAWISPEDTKRELFYCSLRDVQDVKDLLSVGTLDDVIRIVGIAEGASNESVLDMRILTFFAKLRSVKMQMDRILNAEQSSLVSKKVNMKWEAVDGSSRLSKFGIYNILDNLAKGDILKYNEILELNYADVFTKLYRDTILGDLDHEMQQIKTIK